MRPNTRKWPHALPAASQLGQNYIGAAFAATGFQHTPEPISSNIRSASHCPAHSPTDCLGNIIIEMYAEAEDLHQGD